MVILIVFNQKRKLLSFRFFAQGDLISKKQNLTPRVDSNIEDIQSIVGVDTDNKIYRLLDFANKPRNIKDPWYTGNFDETYWDIVEGCDAFLKYLKL